MNTLAYLHSFIIDIEEKYVKSNEDSTHELFFLFLFSQFCDVAKLMIIHKRI